jgi:hypothetical protein
LIAALSTPWNRSISAMHPAPAPEAIEVPVQALFGDGDRQVVPADHVPVCPCAPPIGPNIEMPRFS